jgi:hypothetical protein
MKWSKAKTNDTFRGILEAYLLTLPEGVEIHVEDMVDPLSTKRRLISGRSIGRLLAERDDLVERIGNGRWLVKCRPAKC